MQGAPFLVGNLNPLAVLAFGKASYRSPPTHAPYAHGPHLHAEPRFRVLQAATGEDRYLGREAVQVDRMDRGGLLGETDHDLRGELEEVYVVRLGDERQGRDAHRPHSMTTSSFSLHLDSTTKGPEMRSARRFFCPIIFTRRRVSTKSFCAGSCHETSPRCTPAFSTCPAVA